MFTDIDLRELANMKAPERAFLSLYIAGRHSMADLEKRLHKIGNMLKGGGIEKDEREHFDENVKAVMSYLEQHPLGSGSLCVFSCWALDFFKVIPLTATVKDLVWIGSSPYIRPLAELQDEYENIAVVVADNKKARIFLVSSAVAGSEEVIRGNVKNHVKKGGWSQQRYERRRDKQLHLYANEIVEAISKLEREEKFEDQRPCPARWSSPRCGFHVRPGCGGVHHEARRDQRTDQQRAPTRAAGSRSAPNAA